MAASSQQPAADDLEAETGVDAGDQGMGCADDSDEDDAGHPGANGEEPTLPGVAAASYQLRPQLQASLLEEGGDRAEGLVKARHMDRGIVVVASLLDNLPNMAGLCRSECMWSTWPTWSDTDS